MNVYQPEVLSKRPGTRPSLIIGGNSLDFAATEAGAAEPSSEVFLSSMTATLASLVHSGRGGVDQL